MMQARISIEFSTVNYSAERIMKIDYECLEDIQVS